MLQFLVSHILRSSVKVGAGGGCIGRCRSEGPGRYCAPRHEMIGCQLTQWTRDRTALGELASNIRQALPL